MPHKRPLLHAFDDNRIEIRAHIAHSASGKQKGFTKASIILIDYADYFIVSAFYATFFY